MRKRNNFVERSLMGTLAFIKDSVHSEEHASRAGLLQALDPRSKACGLLLCILQALFTRELTALGCLYLFCLALAALSRINILYFLKRTWFFVPLFSLVVVLPAALSGITPGREAFGFPLFSGRFSISFEGIHTVALFIARVTVSVSFAILLSLTTKHDVLLKSMRGFGIPRVFVMTFGMCYRYIYLFIGTIEHTHTAIKSRTGSAVGHRRGRDIVAWNMAHLWLRSYQMNNQVYSAMLSRGFSGEPKVFEAFKTRPADWLWLVSILAFISVL